MAHSPQRWRVIVAVDASHHSSSVNTPLTCSAFPSPLYLDAMSITFIIFLVTYRWVPSNYQPSGLPDRGDPAPPINTVKAVNSVRKRAGTPFSQAGQSSVPKTKPPRKELATPGHGPIGNAENQIHLHSKTHDIFGTRYDPTAKPTNSLPKLINQRERLLGFDVPSRYA